MVQVHNVYMYTAHIEENNKKMMMQKIKKWKKVMEEMRRKRKKNLMEKERKMKMKIVEQMSKKKRKIKKMTRSFHKVEKNTREECREAKAALEVIFLS